MKILLGKKAKAVYTLDYFRRDNEVAINVDLLVNVMEIKSHSYERNFKLSQLFAYFQLLGLKVFICKIISRLLQKSANERYLSIGYGTIAEGDDAGKSGFFVASNHPRFFDRLTVDKRLFYLCDQHRCETGQAFTKYLGAQEAVDHRLDQITKLEAWSALSGECLPMFSWQGIHQVIEELDAKGGGHCQFVPKGEPAARTLRLAEKPVSGKKTMTVMGFGNYVQTVVKPSLPEDIKIARIHDVDPGKFVGRRHDYDLSTSPEILPDDNSDIVLIAAYHSEHAKIAKRAMLAGKSVIIEKPLCTTASDLAALRKISNHNKSLLWVGYNRRYSSFNAHIYEDLEVSPGDPIDYAAIVSSEPLPEFHWYNWQSSGSRILSNACHWIDHFLCINNDCEASMINVNSNRDGSKAIVTIVLVNGATLTLDMSNKGSHRTGVSEYIELQANNRTVKLSGFIDYQSESNDKVIRRKKINRDDIYTDMYNTIFQEIRSGEMSISHEAIFNSAQIVLEAEAKFQDARVKMRELPRKSANTPLRFYTQKAKNEGAASILTVHPGH